MHEKICVIPIVLPGCKSCDRVQIEWCLFYVVCYTFELFKQIIARAQFKSFSHNVSQNLGDPLTKIGQDIEVCL